MDVRGRSEASDAKTNFVMFGKIKPLLITAVIAIASVWLYNKFLAPKFNLPAA